MTSSSESQLIRILIVDDHLVVREGLTTLLGKENGFIVADAVESGAKAIAFLARNRVDVVLLDLRMPKDSGLDILPQILKGTPPPRVLILSSFELEEEIYRAAKSGAAGYLTKDANRANIVSAIREVASGKLHFPQAIAKRIEERASRTGLSPRELDILRFIAKGLTNREIGHALQISQFTVRNHVIHILGKLDASDRTEAVSIAIQQGIIGPSL